MLEYLLLLYLMGSVYILWYKDLKNIFKPGLTDHGSLVEESSICNLRGFFLSEGSWIRIQKYTISKHFPVSDTLPKNIAVAFCWKKKKSLPSIVKLWLKLTWSIPMKSAKLLTMEIRIVCIYMYMYVCDIRTFWLLLIAMFYILTLVSVCAHSQTLKGHWCCP